MEPCSSLAFLYRCVLICKEITQTSLNLKQSQILTLPLAPCKLGTTNQSLYFSGLNLSSRTLLFLIITFNTANYFLQLFKDQAILLLLHQSLVGLSLAVFVGFLTASYSQMFFLSKIFLTLFEEHVFLDFC